MASGDIFTLKRWKDYYPIELEEDPPHGYFEEGTIVGLMLDADRGTISFFKDGIDLGIAFCTPELKKGHFYPFVQTQCECEISIFHPEVYPAYRSPYEL